MSPGPILVRCPACGQGLRAVLAAGPTTQWFPCPHCHRPVPVVAPRDPPPLYSWEVLSGLYPPLPAPRRPRWSAGRVAQVGLLGVMLLSLLTAGALGAYGVQASTPATFTVSGTVVGASGPGLPISGAQVVLVGEGGFNQVQFTNGNGHFSFSGVPTGGVNLTVSASGYSDARLISFVSVAYDAGSSGLTIDMTPRFAGPSTTDVRTPFPDLESFLSAVGGGVVLCGVAVALSAVGLALVRRSNGAVFGVLGGGAGAGVPAVILLLALSTPFPWLALSGAAAGAFGGFVVAVEAAALARAGPQGT